MFTTAQFLAVLAAAHALNLCLTWLVHFAQHQDAFGLPLSRVHLKAHHEVDPDRNAARLNAGVGHALWAAFVLAGCGIYWLFLPAWMAALFIADAGLIVAFAYFVHREYDRPRSRLERFAWFRKGRALHRVHHSYFGNDFSRSRNYAFGGPVAGNLTDVLFGTFEHALEARSAARARLGHETDIRRAMNEVMRKLAWKTFYGFLARRFPTPQWSFMNYGYHDPEESLPLSPKDEPNRCFIQLYARTLAQAGRLSGLDVLEAGSGRGGGSDWVARTQPVRSVTGMDISKGAVRLSRRRYHRGNLSFVRGDAEKMPFPDASFDVVLNVESCHHYPSLEAFLAEAGRVLRPGGYLCAAFYGTRDKLRRFRQASRATPFETLAFSDITAGVVRALEATEDFKRGLIRSYAPRYLTPMLRFFAAASGSRTHEGLKDGRLEYAAVLLKKPAGVPAATPMPEAARK